MKYSFEDNQLIEDTININKIALVGSDFSWTWEKFELEVNKFVELFSNLAIPKSHPVIIYGHKQAHIIAAKTALMLYGAIYVPADVMFPYERIQMMKEECNSQVLINCTTDDAINELFDCVIQAPSITCIKQQGKIDFELKNPLEPANKINYILFTSGTTGRPKGVPIARRGIIEFSHWISSDFSIDSTDVLLNVSSLSFDFASFDEFLFLRLGATLVSVTSDELKDQTGLIDKILAYKVSVWISTPSLVYLYLRDQRFTEEHLPNLHSFVFAGEALPVKTYQELAKRFPSAAIWNAYGPSEATNLTTSVRLNDSIIEKHNAMPIGYPKPNSKIILLNEDEEGVGEICIQGEHLSPGYLNNEELNQAKFITYENERIYLTGDQGYYKDGLIFYAGRNDEMVKFHGYRIELEDISSTLKQFNEIENASTIGLKSKGETKKIVAFYTAKFDINSNQIVTFLRTKIPEYMIPSDFRKIQEIPLNSSGKIDKKKLEAIYLNKV
jgi:D-alanine--poly(phosphoribitol) ligase subunit 1